MILETDNYCEGGCVKSVVRQAIKSTTNESRADSQEYGN